MKTEQMVLYVLIGAAVGALAIFGIMILMRRRCHPGKCSNIRHSKREGYSIGWGAGSVPQWFITWTPPSSGTGTGYTVTYSGSVMDSNKKQIYSFKNISQPEFMLSDSTPPGTYAVTVIATNQIGQGPAYTQNITLASHIPKFTDNPSLSWPKDYTHMMADVSGVMPDVPTQGLVNTNPGSYTVTFSVKDAKENPIVLTDQSWKLLPTGAHYEGNFPFNISFGMVFNITWEVCNYDMCISKTFQWTVYGNKPGPSSNVGVRFGMWPNLFSISQNIENPNS